MNCYYMKLKLKLCHFFLSRRGNLYIDEKETSTSKLSVPLWPCQHVAWQRCRNWQSFRPLLGILATFGTWRNMSLIDTERICFWSGWDSMSWLAKKSWNWRFITTVIMMIMTLMIMTVMIVMMVIITHQSMLLSLLLLFKGNKWFLLKNWRFLCDSSSINIGFISIWLKGSSFQKMQLPAGTTAVSKCWNKQTNNSWSILGANVMDICAIYRYLLQNEVNWHYVKFFLEC